MSGKYQYYQPLYSCYEVCILHYIWGHSSSCSSFFFVPLWILCSSHNPIMLLYTSMQLYPIIDYTYHREVKPYVLACTFTEQESCHGCWRCKATSKLSADCKLMRFLSVSFATTFSNIVSLTSGCYMKWSRGFTKWCETAKWIDYLNLTGCFVTRANLCGY